MNLQSFLQQLVASTTEKLVKWRQHTSVTSGAFAMTKANGKDFQLQIIMNDNKEITMDIFQLMPQGHIAIAHVELTTNPIGVELYNAAMDSVTENFKNILPDLFASLKPNKKAAKVATLGNVEPEKN